MQTSIPPHKSDAVARALQATFGRTSADTLTPMKFGFSPALVFRADVDERSALLRVELQSDPTADTKRHFECLSLASEAGISPKLLYANAADGVTLSDFVHGRPFNQYAGGREAMLGELASVVRRLQTAPAFPRGPTYFDAIAMFSTQVQASRLFAPGVLNSVITAYRKLADAYPISDPDQAPSHNDLNPTNLLYDGERFWVVDWESGFQGDRYVDLATLANSFAWDPADEALMLDAFFAGEVTVERTARFTLMRLISRFFAGMVMSRVAAFERPADSQPETSLMSPPVRSFFHDPLNGGFGRVMATPDGRLSYGKAMLTEFLDGAESSGCVAAIARLSKAS